MNETITEKKPKISKIQLRKSNIRTRHGKKKGGHNLNFIDDENQNSSKNTVGAILKQERLKSDTLIRETF